MEPAFFLLLAQSFTNCNHRKMDKTTKGDFVHVVFFWLKDPDDAKSRAAFLNELKTYTSEIDEILTYHLGTPADTDRPVIDNSYTYSLLTVFKNKADHDAYQAHPAHTRFVEKASPLWSKVQVYDAVTAQ